MWSLFFSKEADPLMKFLGYLIAAGFSVGTIFLVYLLIKGNIQKGQEKGAQNQASILYTPEYFAEQIWTFGDQLEAFNNADEDKILELSCQIPQYTTLDEVTVAFRKLNKRFYLHLGDRPVELLEYLDRFLTSTEKFNFVNNANGQPCKTN